MMRNQSKSNPVPNPLQWGVNDKILLTNIQRSKSPDIQSFCKLCGRLQEGGDSYMHEFLKAGGVNVLVQAIQNRISRQPLYEVDIVVLYEILLCCAVVVEAPAGIDEFLEISIGIEAVARCLNFDSKIFSLKVLDVLSAFCLHSVDAAQAVFKGLKMSAKSRKEAPFADLTSALIELDVETKKAVLSFVNTLLMALSNSHIYIELKCDLKTQLFDERVTEALQLVYQGIEELNIIDRGTHEGSNVSPPPRISTLLNSSNISGYESVDFGDIYGTPAISNNLGDTSKLGSSSTSESLSIDELYGKATGDDNLTFTDVYDKEIELENNSLGDTCDSTVDDSKLSDLYDRSYAISDSYDNHIPNVEFFSSANLMNDLKPLKNPVAIKKSSQEKSPRNLERMKSFADDLLTVTYNSVGTGDTINVVSKSREVTVTPRTGTMAGVLVVTKSSKHLYMISSKPTIRWFELDNEKLKHTKTTDSAVEEGSMPIASMTDIRSYTTSSAIIKEHLHHTFEIETATHVYAFGCNESAIKDAWLLALSANRERFIVDNSSYKARVVEIGVLTVEKVLMFAEEFKEQFEIYSNIVMEDHRYDVDDLNINKEDIAEVFNYLQGELLVAGLSSKLLLIMHELILVPTYTDIIWDIIYTTVKNIRMKSNKENDALGSAEKLDESVMLSKEFKESGYADVSNLAIITSSLERENKELKGRIRQLEEEYISDINSKKKFLSKEEADESKKILKMAERLKGFEEQAVSDLKTMQRLNDRVQTLEEELEFYKRREAFLSASASVSVSASASTIFESPSMAAPPSNSPNGFADSNPLRRRSSMNANKAIVPENSFPTANNNMVLVSVANSVSTELNASPTQTLSPISVPSNSVSAAADVVAVTLPAPVNEKLEKYWKMIKILPAAAVKQKMSLEGLSASEIDSFLSDVSKAASTSSSNGGSAAPAVSVPPPPPQVDERLEKYRKMIKILPEIAVRQKMALDGYTADQIEAFVQNKGDSPAPAAATAVQQEDVLTSAKYEKYRKMLKLVPEIAVRQKMTVDGLSTSEIEKFFVATNKPASIASTTPANGIQEDAADDFTTPPEDMAAKVQTKKPTVKLKGLFWSKLKSVEVKNTVFHKLDDFSIPSVYLEEIDKLFAASSAKSLSRRMEGPDLIKAENKDPEADGVDGKEKGSKLVSVVDSNRIQNILIVMGKLRLGPEDVMRVIIELDPEVMTTDITSSIKSILPLPEEANAVRLHTDPSKLDHASKLCFHLCRIPRLVTRVECHEIAFSWHSFSNEIFSQLHLVQSALDELGKFQRNMEVVLSMILAIGNYLNADTKWGLAYGFKLETINKLETMRASKTTEGSMIHILSKVVYDQTPDVLAISEKWIAIPAAASISFRQIIADVEMLESQIKKITHEYQRIQDGEVNMGLDGQLEDRQGCVTNPLSRRLEGFLSEATPRMSIISSQMENIERNVSAMMSRYGEKFTVSSDEDLCKKFFQTISLFFRSLRSAADDNLKKRKAAEKQQNLELERKNRSSKSLTKTGEQAKTLTLTESAKLAYFTPLKTKHVKTRRRSKAKTGPTASEIDSFVSESSKAAQPGTTSSADGLAAVSTLALLQVDEARQMMAAEGSTATTMEASSLKKGDDSFPHSDSVNAAPAPAPRLKAKHAKLLRVAAEQAVIS